MNSLFAPFGEMTFKEFYAADLFTSLVRPIVDAYSITCILNTYEDISQVCQVDSTAIFIISFIPFHMRMWQSVNRLYYTRVVKPHTINTIKHFINICVHAVAYLNTQSNPRNEYYELWVSLNTVSTLYNLMWDYYFDWGLFRGSKRSNWMLRDKLKFPTYYYYVAVISNFLLRFTWILPLLGT